MLENPIADLTNPIYWLVVLAFTIFGVANRLVFYHAGKRGGKERAEKGNFAAHVQAKKGMVNS